MGIEATSVYAHHAKVYDARASKMHEEHGNLFELPNLHMSQRTEDSMKINQIKSGAIIIAGSGMCTGGRIKHHFKYNIWRQHSHVLIVGFQAQGTLGRALVNGTKRISLWGENIQVKAKIHTIGGLSAHADQQGLMDWYSQFETRPRIALVHGETDAMNALAAKLKDKYQADVIQAEFKQKLEL